MNSRELLHYPSPPASSLHINKQGRGQPPPPPPPLCCREPIKADRRYIIGIIARLPIARCISIHELVQLAPFIAMHFIKLLVRGLSPMKAPGISGVQTLLEDAELAAKWCHHYK